MTQDRPELSSIDTLDEDTSQIDTHESFETNLNTDKITRRNAIDIYPNDGVVIRELLSNSSTSIQDAKDHGYLSSAEGDISVTLTEVEDNRWKLTIQDNGIGFDENRLDVLAEMGVSTNRGMVDRNAKHGIGFYSSFRLVEAEGVIFITTKSRQTDVARRCMWRLNQGNTFQKGDTIDAEYGATIELMLKESLDIEQLREWIDYHAESIRETVTVVYEPINEDEHTDVYSNQSLLEKYGDSQFAITYSNPYFSLVAAPDIETKRYLIDIHIDATDTSSNLVNYAIRFHTEEQFVIETEDHSVFEDQDLTEIIEDPECDLGKQVLSESEYQNIPEHKQSKYISKSELTESHFTTPTTSGTRDTLVGEKSIMSCIDSHIKTDLQNIVEPLAKNNKITELDKTELEYLFELYDNTAIVDNMRRFSDLANMYRTDEFIKKFQDTFADFNIIVENSTVDHISSDNNWNTYQSPISTKAKYNKIYYQAAELHLYAEKKNIPVYMCVTYSEKKYQAAKKIHSDVILVSVDSTDEYELYQPLGWNKLKSVTKSSIDQYELSTDTESAVRNILSTDTTDNNTAQGKEETFSVRFGDSITPKMSTVTIEELTEKLAEPKVHKFTNLQHLVLFPESSQYNISDYYDLAGSSVAIMKCPDRHISDLSKFDKVSTFSEYYDNSSEQSVITPHGIASIQDIPFQSQPIRCVIISENTLSNLHDLCDDPYTHIPNVISRISYRKQNEFTYILLSKEKEQIVRPYLHEKSENLRIFVEHEIETTYQWSNDVNEFYPHRFLGLSYVYNQNLDSSVQRPIVQFLLNNQLNLSTMDGCILLKSLVVGAKEIDI